MQFWPGGPEWKVAGAFHPASGGHDAADRQHRQHGRTGGESGRRGIHSATARRIASKLLDQGEPTLFLVYADRTSGHGSYPAGRYLDLARPTANQQMTIDFNRARKPAVRVHRLTPPVRCRRSPTASTSRSKPANASTPNIDPKDPACATPGSPPPSSPSRSRCSPRTPPRRSNPRARRCRCCGKCPTRTTASYLLGSFHMLTKDDYPLVEGCRRGVRRCRRSGVRTPAGRDAVEGPRPAR